LTVFLVGFAIFLWDLYYWHLVAFETSSTS